MKRFWISLMALVLALLCVVSCNKGGDEAATTTAGVTEAPTTTPVENNTPVDNTLLPIIVDGKSDAVIVVGDGDAEAAPAANYLRDELYKVYGFRLKKENDLFLAPDPNRVEILIGFTNREESQAAAPRMERIKDFLCEKQGNKLLLMGFNEEGLKKGVNYLLNKYVWNDCDGKNFTYSSEMDFYSKGSYDIPLLKCAGQTMYQAKIVYPANSLNGEYYAAMRLYRYLFYRAGINMPVVDDSTPSTGQEIRIGKTVRGGNIAVAEGKYNISVKDGNLCLAANDVKGYLSLFEYLENTILTKAQASLILTADYTRTADAEAIRQKTADYRLVFQNIWGPSGNDSQRDEVAAEYLLSYNPDVIGLNEFVGEFRSSKSLHNKLLANGFAYVDTKVGYNANGVPIYYRADRFTLIDSDYITESNWRYEGSTIAMLEDKVTKDRFIVVCTHFPANNDNTEEGYNIGIGRRTQSLDYLNETLEKFWEKNGKAVTYMGGDYNNRGDKEICQRLETEGWVNCHTTAEARWSDYCSCQGYPEYDEKLGLYYAPNLSLGNYSGSIDQIFRIGEGVEEKLFATLKDEIVISVADHCPVLVDFSFQ